ncbi:MAG: phosphoglucosamine mutase, partial [Candidatus Omnitrophica bacterium]|nr:phosphoglucosamine mutase [Candidatus Omnitrophota bacterium]
GIVGRSLTPELLTRLGAAFGTYMKAGHIVIGRDTRTSGDMVKYSVFSGLLSTGCNITDIDISTTPSCQIMIEELGADGGIVISASHNPIEWNALKLFKSNGMYLNKEESKEFFDIYHKGNFLKAEWNQLKDLETDVSTVRRHLKKVLKHIDIEKIRRRKFKVALDSCNGAGSTITPILLEKLGCQVVSIHCLPNGLFPHNPEPIFINLGDLSKLVKKTKADIGFAQDADADRVAIITEKGQILSEEYSLSMTTQYRLSQKKGTVVVNLSTSRAIDDIADSYGVPVIRTAVGEINVAEKLKEVNGVIGGEGNGGVIDPRVHYGRDSLAGIVIMLEYLACEKEPISKLAGR